MKGMYLAAVAIVTAALAAPAALASPPAAAPTLTGEQLTAVFPPSPPSVRATCDPTGTSTLSATLSGVATGPYPGTWTAVVSARIGPQTGAPGPSGFRSGPLLELREVFRIVSPAGTVIGTKTLRPAAANVGVCRQLVNEQPPDTPLPFVNLNGYVYELNAPALAYTAAISMGRRAYRDEGTSGATLTNSRVTCCPNEAGVDLETRLQSGSFGEQFVSAPQTRPGDGCGDRNHEHEGRDDCQDQQDGHAGGDD
jgi:hypothetical protein